MGEIAEDMIDCTCCTECGCYFMDEENQAKHHKGEKAILYTHGYPVLCKECWTPESDLQCADVNTI